MGRKRARTLAVSEHSSNEQLTTKKTRNGPVPVAKNLQEYLQINGYKDQNDNNEKVISVRSKKGEREHVDESDEEVEVSSPGSSLDSSNDGSPADSKAEKESPSNALPSSSKSKRPMTVEIVGSSSSDHDSSMELPPRTRTRSSLKAAGSNCSSRASDSVLSNGIDSVLENPFPTPPSSDSSSSGSRSSGDSDPSPGPSTRSRRSTTVTEKPAKASTSLETSSSSSTTVSTSKGNTEAEKQKQDQQSFKKPNKPAARTIVMTPRLRQHFKKYSKLKLRVELTCIDDDGEIPGRPELEPRPGEPGDGTQQGGASAKTAKTMVAPVCRHQGERHLIILPSLIHGRGLFTTNSIKAGEMIIEYAGEVVSSKVALQRQNWYIQRQIHNYVMHIDKELHIDATNLGNCSRYINHSCEPNCTAEVLNIRGAKRVLIIALKDIDGGEELTYDYRFTSDELVPCYCTTPSCRLFLNHNIASLKLKPSEIKDILKAHREG